MTLRRFLSRPLGHRRPNRPSIGTVTLVGAGPGGADLITVRGARALAGADVVVYDRLADPELLDLAPVRSRRIAVGKGKGFGSDQREINATLVGWALRGAAVVRLKGGDPFVFGRGGEEVDACAAAGVPVEVVPGVSSALAAPGLAGIPVTDRRYAASFTVLTGHRAAELPSSSVLAASGDTLIVLMGASTAAEVGRRLLAAGRRPAEPVAFVHAAGTADQRVTTATLADMADSGCPFPAPTVLVVGEVAAVAGTDRPGGGEPQPVPVDQEKRLRATTAR